MVKHMVYIHEWVSYRRYRKTRLIRGGMETIHVVEGAIFLYN